MRPPRTSAAVLWGDDGAGQNEGHKSNPKITPRQGGNQGRLFEVWVTRLDGRGSKFYARYSDLETAVSARDRLREWDLLAELRILGRREGAM